MVLVVVTFFNAKTARRHVVIDTILLLGGKSNRNDGQYPSTPVLWPGDHKSPSDGVIGAIKRVSSKNK